MKDLDERLKDWASTRQAGDPSAGSTASLIQAASHARRGNPWLRVLLVVPLLVVGWLLLREPEVEGPQPAVVDYTLGHQVGLATVDEEHLSIAEGRLNFRASIDDYALDRRSELSFLEDQRWELVKGTLAVKRQSGKGGRTPLTVLVRGHEVQLVSSGKYLIRNEPEGAPSVWAMGKVEMPEELERHREGWDAIHDEQLWSWLIEEEPEATHIPAEGSAGTFAVDTMLIGVDAWTEVLVYGRRVEVLSGAVAIDAFETYSLLHGPNAHIIEGGTMTGDARGGSFQVGEGDPLGLLGERTGPALENPGDAWLELAELHLEQGENTQAREAYEAALRLGGPHHRTTARLGLGRLAERMDRPEAAIGHYNAALADGPGELENELRWQLIRALQAQERWDEAELHEGLLR